MNTLFKEMENKIETMNSKKDFLEFMELLIKDLRVNSKEWENKNLEDFLEGMIGWTEGLEVYLNYKMEKLPKEISWKVFASILFVARIYE